jgi:formylglycine-generating enzyme required for sulfatase activity
MRKPFTLIFLVVMPILLVSNNIAVNNLKITGQNTTDHYSMIQFDLSWDNSFRTSTGPANWDAAWIFVKYRIAVSNGGDGLWIHARLNDNGHVAPSGSTISTGFLLPGSAFNATTNPGLGIFIYPSANGTGTFSKTGVQIRWNYGANGLADNEVADIRIYAIEMVYVPQAAFIVGTGGTERGSFTNGAWSGTDAVTPSIPLTISSENAITVAHSAGNLWYSLNWPDWYGDQGGPIPALFPKGFAGFYCMKYELSQQGYVDFLNTLTYTQQVARTIIAPNSAAGTYLYNKNRYKIKIATSGTSTTIPAVYATDFPDMVCNFVDWADMCAYLDWSGLRPMTELEFEKACRGPGTPTPNEYAWGTASIASSLYTLNNSGQSNEGIASNYSTTAGNATFLNTDDSSTAIKGPFRAGIFAAHPANTGRITSGATYYGIMEMTGNNWERPVTVGCAAGRSFTGLHGDGALNSLGQATVDYWPGINGNTVRTTPNTVYGGVTGITNSAAAGSGFRGGDWDCEYRLQQVADRFDGDYLVPGRCNSCDARGVRTAH